MAQRICSAVQAEVAGAESDLHPAVDDMVIQLNNNTNELYQHYESDYTVQTSPSGKTEEQFIKDAINELDNAGHVQNEDAWIIADGADHASFGYGTGDVTWSTGIKYAIGCRALHTPSQWVTPDPVETFHNLVIHELGHCFNAEHWDGTYEVSNGVASDVSPMATFYTYVTSDDGVSEIEVSDTCFDGTGHIPDQFCNAPDNYTADDWCGNCDYSCRHTTTMSSCTLQTIADNTPPI